VAVAVLLDAQSPFYELLHKPDAIGLGVLALALGQAPDGTLEGFYPVVDVALTAVFGWMLLRVVRLARAPHRPTTAASGWRRVRRAAALGFRGYLDIVVPIAILAGAPNLLGAGWPALIRTDLGLVLAVLVGLRLADGLVRVGRTRAVRHGVARLVAVPAR